MARYGKVFPLDNGMCALYDDHCDPSKLSFKTLWPAIMAKKCTYNLLCMTAQKF